MNSWTENYDEFVYRKENKVVLNELKGEKKTPEIMKNYKNQTVKLL